MNFSKYYDGISFRISDDFDCATTFDELVEKCDFCFNEMKGVKTHTEPRLSFKEPFISDDIKINWIGLSYKNDGLVVSGCGFKTDIPLLNDITKRPVEIIAEFLEKEGAEDLIFSRERRRAIAFPLSSACA